MPKSTIPNKGPKTKKDQPYQINGVTILPENEKFMSDIFKDIDPAKLRKEAWQRSNRS